MSEEEFISEQYYRRKSKIYKMKRNIAFARSNIRRLRCLIRLILFCLLIYSSYAILNLNQWYLNQDDILNLNPDIVKIEGTIITPKYKVFNIIRATEVPNEPIFKYSAKPLEEALMELQSIKRAYVRRFWFPARIIVFLEEREPVFLIAPNEESQPISAITKDGYYIDREYMPIPKSFKTTKILSYGINGDDYENWDKKRVDEISMLIKKIETYSKQKVEYLDLRDQNDVYAKLPDVLLRIGSIDDTTDDRIKWIPTILPQVSAMGKKVKYIDFRWKDARYIKYEDEPSDNNKKSQEEKGNKNENNKPDEV